jgi:hypothetical protein
MFSETLQKCVIDICMRSFKLLGSDGSERQIFCNTPQQFLDVLAVVEASLPEDQVSYAGLLTM